MTADDGERIRREWRIALILLGLGAVVGGLLFGFYEMLVLGVSYAHDSSPTPEFRAAGDAKMMLALLLVITGVACLLCRRAKHVVIVGALFAAVVLNLGIAVWLDDLSERSARDGYAIVAPAGP